MGSRYDCRPRDIISRGRRLSRGQHVISRGYIVLVTSRGCIPWTHEDIPWVSYTVDIHRGEHVTSRGYIVLILSRGCIPWVNIL